MGAVLAQESIVWFPITPVGEGNTFATRFKNPVSLRMAIGDAQPEINFLGTKVATPDLGKETV